MAKASRPTSISFDDFTHSTLRAVRAALDDRNGGSGPIFDPEILIGIVIRPPRDLPDLKTIDTLKRG